jgi:hypothetical protein
MATDEDGNEIGWEEYYDYNFPDDEKKVMGFKILENAMKWKLAAAAALEGMCLHIYIYIYIHVYIHICMYM